LSQATAVLPKERLDFRRTFLLGFGMFSISIASALYNAYVPLFLRHYLTSVALIGAIVAFRSLSGLILNLYFAARSDRTWTRLGRRMPYIVIGMPIAGLLFLMFPWQFGAVFLVVIDIVYAFSSNIFYAPTIALMPDVTPAPLRSQANGIINLLAGVGALLAFFGGPILYGVSRDLPFLLVGLLFFVIPALMRWGIREPADIPRSESVGLVHLWRAAVEVWRNADRTGVYLLLAIFFWTAGESSVDTFFVTYGVYHLHLTSGTAVITIGIFAVAYLLGAYPSGILSGKIGRRLTLQIGALVLGIAFLAIPFLPSLLLLRAVAFVGGLGWALVNINGYPWVTDLTKTKMGAYTGLYILSTGLATVAAQPLIGLAMDHLGYQMLFYLAGPACLVALLLLFGTRAPQARAAK
jgi:MFS family permease